MKKIIILSAILFMANVADARVFVRDDGGRPIINGVGECDGTVDAPKSEDGHCAYSYIYQERSADPDSDDEIVISKGKFAISVQPPANWISMTEFMSNPKKYTDLAKNGKKVYINNYNGRVYEITLKY